MLCTRPFVKDPTGRVFRSLNREDWKKGIPFPCGKCLACRINKRKEWTSRLFLESLMHDFALFLTITYDDKHIRLNNDLMPILCKRDVQLFLKRLRAAVDSTYGKIRYYFAGEYGETTERPHYHAIIFGLPPIPAITRILEKCWPFGFVYVGDCTHDSIQYVAGYVTKKLGATRLDGRPKEFATMSLRPALGRPALETILQGFKTAGVVKYNEDGTCDFPTSVAIGRRNFPLGRTLCLHLARLLGCERKNEDYLFDLCNRAIRSDRDDVCLDDGLFVGSLAKSLINESAQRNRQISAKFKIYNTRSKV